METKIRGLSNDEYHRGDRYKDWLSSTQLKHYLKSPKVFRHYMDNGEQSKSEVLEFGSLFHEGIEQTIKGRGASWLSEIAVFEPPVNEKTGQPYGTGTKTYSESYVKFLEASKGKTVTDAETHDRLGRMLDSLFRESGKTSEQVCKLCGWAKEIETSYFFETDEGVKLKIRPDMLTNGKLIDWKSISAESLDEETVIRQVFRYRYDFSLAMYQWVLHEIEGKWYDAYLVFVSKEPPYESVIVDMSDWCYRYDRDWDIVSDGIGAKDFQRVLKLHAECMNKNEWPGAESQYRNDDGLNIMRLSVPSWVVNKYKEDI